MASDSPEYLIAEILPSFEVHLLGGSSGSGKTTFLFQMLADWQDSKPVLGHESCPVPYAYVSIDRSRSSVVRTLTRLGLQDKITRIVSREDLPSTLSLGVVIQSARERYPDAQCFFVEGFQTLVGDKGNSYTDVAKLLQATTQFCAEQKVTIVGICHSPKLKIEEGFQHPREMLLGSVAWAAYSDTIIIMDLDEKTKIVNCHVLPRNAASEVHPFVFMPPNGHLAPPPNSPKQILVSLLMHQEIDSEISRSEVLEMGESLGLSQRSTDRVIAQLVEEREYVQTIRKGWYRRSKPTQN